MAEGILIKEGGERVTNVTRIITELDDDLTVKDGQNMPLKNLYVIKNGKILISSGYVSERERERVCV